MISTFKIESLFINFFTALLSKQLIILLARYGFKLLE